MSLRDMRRMALEVLLERHSAHHDIIIDCNSTEFGTSLHTAAEFGRVDIVKVLLQRGAKVNQLRGNGCTALHYAASNGEIEVVKELLSRPEIDSHVNTPISGTPLHEAAIADNFEILKLLLQTGSDVEAASEDEGYTVLHSAARFGSVGIVKYLLSHTESAINRHTKHHGSALHLAVIGGHAEIVKVLLRNNIDANAIDSEGCTALHRGVEKADAAIVEQLLEHSHIDATESAPDVGTVLDLAKANGHSEIVELLSKHVGTTQ